MRLVRIVGEDFGLDLHPYVTVVSNLDAEARSAVLETIRGIPRGRVGPLGGLLEVHGIVLDLDEASLELLDLDDRELSPVVTLGEIPGHGDSGAIVEVLRIEAEVAAAAQRAEEARAACEEQQVVVADLTAEVEKSRLTLAELDEELTRLDGGTDDLEARRVELSADAEARRNAVDDARHALEAASVRLADQVEAAIVARRKRDTIATEGTAMAARLESIEQSLDQQATEDLTSAEKRLSEVRVDVDSERGEDDTDHPAEVEPSEPVESKLARLEVMRTELDARLAVLGGADTLAVENALAAIRADDENNVVLVASPDALALASEIRAVEQRLVEIGPSLVENAGTVATARDRLDLARNRLAEVEHEVRLPQLERDDVDELEMAHADVLAAQEKAEGRFAGTRSGRRLEDARDAERVVLERLGFSSYADYMMGTSMLNVDDESEAELEAARGELAESEDAWAALQTGVESELDHVAVSEELRALHQRAMKMLDSDRDQDLVERLEAHQVPASTDIDALEQLSVALQSVGLAVAREDLDREELEVLAEEWLEEERLGDTRREHVLAERVDVDLGLEETRSTLSRAAAGMAGPSPEARRRARLDEAAAAVAAAQERKRRHDEALAEVEALRASVTAASEQAAEAAEVAEECEVQLEAAKQEVDEHDRRLHETEAALVAAEIDFREVEAETITETRENLESRRAEAQEDVDGALERESSERERLADAENRSLQANDEHASAAARLDSARRLADESPEEDENADIDEVEWYLMSRLATQRRVSYAGSVPLVIDGALDGFSTDDAMRLLDRLERMAAAVQFVVLTDSVGISEWAEAAGDSRGAVAQIVAPGDLIPFP